METAFCWLAHAWFYHFNRKVNVVMMVASAKRPYFYFGSKIWRHHHVPRPQFPIRRGNFGDSWTFKADIAFFIFAWVFRTSGSKMVFLRGKIEEGWGDIDPQRGHSYFWGFTRLCPIWWKLTKKCDRESVHRWTVTHTLRRKMILLPVPCYNAICYSCGADNDTTLTFSHCTSLNSPTVYGKQHVTMYQPINKTVIQQSMWLDAKCDKKILYYFCQNWQKL